MFRFLVKSQSNKFKSQARYRRQATPRRASRSAVQGLKQLIYKTLALTYWQTLWQILRQGLRHGLLQDLARHVSSRSSHQPYGTILVVVLLTPLLSTCTSRPKPRIPDNVAAVGEVQGVTPRREPASRYGNPREYTVFGRDYQVQNTSYGYRQQGIASWYGPKFHGKRTSSGETYDMHAMTAAHKSLPIPTYVQVTRLDNGRSIVVKVNDRGPFVGERIIDLSNAAAKAIDMVGSGTVAVEVRALPPYQYLDRYQGPRHPEQPLDFAIQSVTPPTVSAPKMAATVSSYQPVQAPIQQASTQMRVAAQPALYLQAGAFSQMDGAQRLQTWLQHSLTHKVMVDNSEPAWYRVVIGPVNTATEEQQVRRHLQQFGIHDIKRIRRATVANKVAANSPATGVLPRDPLDQLPSAE